MDTVQDLVDDIKDLVEVNQDISDVISSAVPSNDEHLEHELQKLIEEDEERDLEAALAKLEVNPSNLDEGQEKRKEKVLETVQAM